MIMKSGSSFVIDHVQLARASHPSFSERNVDWAVNALARG